MNQNTIDKTWNFFYALHTIMLQDDVDAVEVFAFNKIEIEQRSKCLSRSNHQNAT